LVSPLLEATMLERRAEAWLFAPVSDDVLLSIRVHERAERNRLVEGIRPVLAAHPGLVVEPAVGDHGVVDDGRVTEWMTELITRPDQDVPAVHVCLQDWGPFVLDDHGCVLAGVDGVAPLFERAERMAMAPVQQIGAPGGGVVR